MDLKKYVNEYNIRSYECDRNNNMRILALLNIFQDMADHNSEEMGIGFQTIMEKGLAWVGTNYVIDIDRLPEMHENIRIETWSSGEKKITGLREFEVFGENKKSIIRATSQWALIDYKKRRPVPLLNNVPEFKFLPERAVESDFPKLPEVERVDVTTKFRVRFDDIDLNKHVNNAVYILWSSEAVEPEFRLEHNPKHVEINFRKEGLMGEKIMVKTQCEGLHTFHSISTYDGDNNRELARSYIEWD